MFSRPLVSGALAGWAMGDTALGIGVGDRVAILEHAYYSVISPEGCAGILWKSHEYAEKAADALRFTSGNLHKLGIVDEVIEEPLGGAHRDHQQTGFRVKNFLVKTLRELTETPSEELLNNRYEKFRRMGVFLEEASEQPEQQAEQQAVDGAGAGGESDDESDAA